MAQNLKERHWNIHSEWEEQNSASNLCSEMFAIVRRRLKVLPLPTPLSPLTAQRLPPTPFQLSDDPATPPFRRRHPHIAVHLGSSHTSAYKAHKIRFYMGCTAKKFELLLPISFLLKMEVANSNFFYGELTPTISPSQMLI